MSIHRTIRLNGAIGFNLNEDTAVIGIYCSEQLQEIKVPTLVVGARHDVQFPLVCLQESYHDIPNSQLFILAFRSFSIYRRAKRVLECCTSLSKAKMTFARIYLSMLSASESWRC